MKQILFTVLAATMLTGTAQAQDNDYDEPKEITLTAAERKLVMGNNDFAIRLYRQVRSNLSDAVSPLSITFALGMLNNGAAGLTQQEMNEVLGFGDAGADGINVFCRKMLDEMPTLDDLTRVMLSNAIFLNEPRHLLPDFELKAHDYYDAVTQTRNFDDGETMDVINQWASDHTMGMIDKVLTPETFNPLADSYLLNAVYFKGTWTLKFDKAETREESFNGGEPVPMMHLQNLLHYTENDLFQMLQLPYGNEAYQMALLLPREGMTVAQVLESLDAELWLQYQWLPAQTVDVKLPRMDITTRLSLVEPMKALGMTRAFVKEEAEIPYYCDRPQYISNMSQVAKIKMDEEGTEAAAVTVIETTNESIPDEPRLYEFHATRPFLYIISERSTGTILFIGQYLGENTSGSSPDGLQRQETARRNIAPKYYDLTGRRLNALPARGIVIENGRKILR